MSAPVAASPAKKVVKATKPKKPSAHPSFEVMIAKAIAEQKSRSGSSRAALLKYISANFNVNKATVQAQLRTQLRRLVQNGMLVQVTPGSFKVSEALKTKLKNAGKPKKAKKPAATKAKKPAAKKAKAAGTKKPKLAGAKKPKAAAAKKPKAAGAKKPKAAGAKKPKAAGAKKAPKKAAAKPKKAASKPKKVAKKAAPAQ